ncbi:MAG TPA: hypothetical protein VM487_25805 [Phycisphaerae bacterium]|nr:hypothetical protein [Phycisphaerae bacterium]
MPMKPRKLNRDLLIAGGLEVTGNTTITGTLAQVGVATFTAAPVFSAGLTNAAQKSGIIMSTGGYIAEKVQTLNDYAALTDTGGSSKAGYQAILGYGVTKISVTGTSGTTAGSTSNDLVFKLSSPIKAGVLKEIYITGTSASTKVVSIRTATSTHVFFGSTKNSIAYTTTVNNLGFGFPLLLRGLSTTQWALGPLAGIPSTASAIAGATA